MNKLLVSIIILFLLIIGIILVRMQPDNNQTGQINATPSIEPTPAEGTSTPEATASGQMTAIIKTAKGDIVLSLFPNEAPKTVANFVSKAQSGYYNNLTFHRVEDWVIQGGDPLGNGTGGGTMPTELNEQKFVIGSLGVARGQDIAVSNDSQFFITKTEASWLNRQYTNFGIVTSGLEVVNKIVIGDKILEITIK
jgi:cyclophilin family peptidyl-prolyl cis-trans isomerase